ncbi:hypothetical protein BN109_021 [Yersinia phage phi80-18]|uniref:Uncharacterized protein n=1 Tax=Yersinia phage phi80-18 TaxID=1206559 RepID=I7KRI3_9CAUD|nr:hypothetical protein BN109_021 [Yersinia phage phi80-18]CCI88860.2 hypothetical protein BN109_021 [Yersinia phage phi80-18]
MSKFIVCTVTSYFCKERDCEVSKVDKPLQVLNSLKEAREVYVIMNPFYNYDLHIVSEAILHEEFR